MSHQGIPSLYGERKETRSEKEILEQRRKVCIGNLMKDSHVTLTGEKTPEHFKDSITAANSIGKLTWYTNERQRILLIFALDYL